MYSIPPDSRNVSVDVDGTSVVWGTVSQPYSGIIEANSMLTLSLQTIAGSLPAAGYSSSVTIQTTQPAVSYAAVDPTATVTVSSGVSFTVSWAINILQALVFPVQQAQTLVPSQRGTVLVFAVANFAGAPIQVRLQNDSLPSWMVLSVGSDVVQNGDMITFNVTVNYPTASSTRRRAISSACGVGTLPGTVGPDEFINVSMGLTAWRLPLGTTAQTLSTVDDAIKVPVPLQTPGINIPVITALGAPSVMYSCVDVSPDGTNCTVGDTVSIPIEVRDAGGNLIPFSAASASIIGISVSCEETDACQQIIAGPSLAEVVDILNTTNVGVYAVSIKALATGPLLIQMSIDGISVGGPSLLNASGIGCGPHQLTLDGVHCVCAAGYFLPTEGNRTACTPCPGGSYNPKAAAIGLAA